MRSIRRQTTSRLWLVGGAMLAIAGALSYRLYELQVHQAPAFQARSLAQRVRTIRPDAPRLSVVDRANRALAIDEPIYDLYVHPYLIDRQAAQLATRLASKRKGVDRQALIAQLTSEQGRRLRSEMATVLSEATNRPLAELTAKLNRPSRTVPVARGLSETSYERVKSKGLVGLEVNTRRRRFYPEGQNSAALVGFLNYEGSGQGGIEQSYQKRLRPAGTDFDLAVSPSGAPIAPVPESLLSDPLTGRLALTVDSRLQRAARVALERGVKAVNATRGTAIVLDPKSGEVLAMAVAPSFDNNRYSQFPPAQFKNWAVSDLYEPGSTFKPINIALALSAGAIKPTTVIYDSGRAQFGRYSLSNYDRRGRGSLSVTQVLMYSSNVGMIRLMQQLNAATYFDKLKELDIRRPSGIDLPGETPGIITTKKQFVDYPVQAATVSFGQGIALTPLQLARLHGAIANGGLLVQPRIVRALEDDNGKTLWQPTLAPPKPVFTAEATAQVRKMMEHVVQEGTGKPARIPGYRLGGKTGTAQKANIGGRGYLAGRLITSFVGYLPAQAPRFVILVVLDEPKAGVIAGSTTAAPVVREICLELISYANLLPTHPQEIVAAQAKTAPARR